MFYNKYYFKKFKRLENGAINLWDVLLNKDKFS